MSQPRRARPVVVACTVPLVLAALLRPAGATAQGRVAIDRPGPVLVNQAGYNLGEAKRFTVPGAPDGTTFRVRRYLAPGPGEVGWRVGEVMYEGTISEHSGYFSDFDPISVEDQYVVEVDGHGTSYPFWIGDHLMEKLSSRLAYQFFIDVRGATDLESFDPTLVAGGGPSRDGGGYTLETVFETLLYASNPALFDRWTDELAPDTTPDLIDLILWHAAFSHRFLEYNGPTAHRPYDVGYPGTTLQSYDYQNHLDQLAAVLAAYRPFLHRYMDESTYREYRRSVLDRWEAYDRHRVVRNWIRSRKWIDEGWQEFSEMGNAYGQAVFRNLFMYLAESHEPDGQAEKFLRYAREAATDIVRNWDFDNPRHMWAMRNAEHITPQALAFFIMVAPGEAPAGTREKLQAWRDYVMARTDNLWQYRTHDGEEWAHPRSKEVGTVAGLGGSMFAVASVLGDEKLREIGWSQVNFVFGLNPVAAHLSARTEERTGRAGYWDGVERGWPDAWGKGAGMLYEVRGALDGSPIDAAFPFHPEAYAGADKGDAHAVYASEGWAVTNRAWMSTVAFSTLGSHSLRLLDSAGETAVGSVARGDSLRVELRAALNQDYGDPEELIPSHDDARESGWVEVRLNQGAARRIAVRETGPNTGVFTAIVKIGQDEAPEEATVAADPGDVVEFSYGYLAFRRAAYVTVR